MVEETKPALRKLSRNLSGPSIKSLLNGPLLPEEKLSFKEQHELYTQNDLSEKFSEEQLLSKWKQYLGLLDDRPNLKSTLARDPVLQCDGTILLKIDNYVQDDIIKAVKPQIVTWLRRELKNSNIDLFTEISCSGLDKIVYTDGDKFEEMLQKNPDLAYLKQRFSLDFEG